MAERKQIDYHKRFYKYKESLAMSNKLWFP